MLHALGCWWYKWCTTSFFFISPKVLVVYTVYFIVQCYIPQDTGGIIGVLNLSILHLPAYWRCIRCITTLYVTSSRVLVVYMVYYIILRYNPLSIGGVYGVLHKSMLHPQGTGVVYCVLHHSMLHPPEYWWYNWRTTSINFTSPSVLVVYTVYYNVICYIPLGGTGGEYGLLHHSMLHPSEYWWYIWCNTLFYVTSPRVVVVNIVYYIILCYIPQESLWYIWCSTSF